MRQSFIISDIEASSLILVRDIAKRSNQTELYLLSDAVFMLNDKNLNKILGQIQDLGTMIFAIKEDVEKRKPVYKDIIQEISYEDFVERLVSNDVKIINL